MIQLEVIAKITSSIYVPPNQKPGDVVWVNSEKAARELIEGGYCKLLGGKVEALKPGQIMRRSNAWPLDRFAVIEPTWKGETVVCIGGGPSLTPEDVERIKGRARVIAVNDAYLVAPFADICYFADARWWKWHSDGIAKKWPWASFTADEVRKAFAEFKGQKVTIENTGMMVADPAVFILHNDNDHRGSSGGLSERPNGIRTGSNGGYQAMNIATLAGAKRILLLAYDMHYPKGRSHSHNGHPIRMNEDAYRRYAHNFKSMLPQLQRMGVEVVNCTPGSALSAFPIRPLAEVAL